MSNDANMPANNTQGSHPSLGTSMGHSKIVASSGGGKGTAVQPKGAKANMPVSNNNTNSHKLGTTHHGVGEQPGYMTKK